MAFQLARFLPALLFASLGCSADEEAVEIIRRAFDASEANFQTARDYTYHERIEHIFRNKKGKVEEQESKTWEVVLVDGSEHRRLIAKNDEPLGAKQEAKEERKLQKSIEKMRGETPEQRAKRRAKAAKERERDQRYIREIIRAYDFKMWGEEPIDGIDAWVIYAEPRPGYEPSFRRANVLKKLRGRLWISKADYGWIKADIDTIEGFSWGLFLLKLHRGAKIEFTQQWFNDEVWLLDSWRVQMSGRAGLIARFDGELLGNCSNFRKFSADSSITFGDALE